MITLRMKKKLHSKIFVLLVIILVFFSGCKNDDRTLPLDKKQLVQVVDTPETINISPKTHNNTRENSRNWNFKYDLTQPKQCVLANELVEISALTLDNESDILYAVNDEKAFIYALEDCKVSSKFDFGKKGDYEGIEMVDNELYVLKSSGRIIQYDLISEDVKRVIKTPLKTKNDSEGLGYDKEKNTLLIACKGSPNIERGSKYKKSKAIYSYDLDNDVFIDQPLFLIDDNELESFLKKQDNSQYSKKETKRRLKRALDFSPSAISKNPIDNSYYLLSTVGKILLVVNPEFQIVAIQFLDHPSFIQPEGICFDSNGGLFISNEGKGLVANILEFPSL